MSENELPPPPESDQGHEALTFFATFIALYLGEVAALTASGVMEVITKGGIAVCAGLFLAAADIAIAGRVNELVNHRHHR